MPRNILFAAAMVSAVLAAGLVAATPASGGQKGDPLEPAFKENFGLPRTMTLSKDVLKDKIKGGWAGQTIGCTFGGPTEFRFKGTFIPDFYSIPWSEDAIASSLKNSPGLYDDVYMDLTFVGVFEKKGLDAPAASFAAAFAGAKYPLWHANQMARYNILNGLFPPESGHWLKNPHADDIDFQIEADFAGLMSPGIPNAASEICDKIGHIMTYGDGWYGGVYIAAMYALAFVSDDIEFIAAEALKTIPAETTFARTMRDVIRWHRKNPADWKETWRRVQEFWSEDRGCPEGVFSSFDIDAKINAAWVLLGLLFGEGNFGKTLSISARCGDDSDCNPATAGGILGTMLGYKNIPGTWTKGLERIAAKTFPYTSISLDEASALSLKHALENVRRNGGRVGDTEVGIAVQRPRPVRTEIGFEGHFPAERRAIDRMIKDQMEFAFDGIGFAVNAEAVLAGEGASALLVEMAIDERPIRIVNCPADILLRNPTPFWKYQLAPGHHKVRLKILNPGARSGLRIQDIVIYADKPPRPEVRFKGRLRSCVSPVSAWTTESCGRLISSSSTAFRQTA